MRRHFAIRVAVLSAVLMFMLDGCSFWKAPALPTLPEVCVRRGQLSAAPRRRDPGRRLRHPGLVGPNSASTRPDASSFPPRRVGHRVRPDPGGIIGRADRPLLREIPQGSERHRPHPRLPSRPSSSARSRGPATFLILSARPFSTPSREPAAFHTEPTVATVRSLRDPARRVSRRPLSARIQPGDMIEVGERYF